eukprot:g7570.t1
MEPEHLLKLRQLLAPQAEAPRLAKRKAKEVDEVQGPDWTSRYCVVDAAAPLVALDSLAIPLQAPVAEALKKNGFDPLFPIQAMVIPLLSKSAEAADDEDSAYCCDVCEDTGLSSWSGCGNHPGLVNGSFYCANTITAPVDLNEYLGSWEVLQGLMPVTCLAYNWELQAISLSFDPELSTEFLLPLFPVVFKLSGFTFAPNSQVALLDYMGADLQLRTGESLTTQVAVGGVVELAIGIPIILEIVLPLEGVFGMNLDSSAQGELASGHQVLESMVKADTSVASNWAVVIQTSFRPELVLLGFTFNFPISTKSQVLVRAGSSIIPDMYLSSMLYHATSLSELMGGLPDLGPVCDMDFLPKEVRESPFCHGDENMDTMEDDAEVALYFALEDGVAVIDLRAWGMWLAVKADSNAQSPLTLCKDGQCSQPFCVWDSQCPEGYHCCKTTFEFTCQKQYRHRVLGNVLTCAELPAMQAVDLAVDPGKGKNEGESCTWDSECALKLHCYLALQVFRVFQSLCKALPSSKRPRLQCAVGAQAMAQEQQLLKTSPPDILVCTPGRLAEHFLGRGLEHYFFFVGLQRQTVGRRLFSATMTWDPRKLAQLKLLRPLYFFSSRTGQYATPAQLQQHYLRCPANAKPLAEYVLKKVEAEHAKVLVFCQSVNTAHRLARLLQIACALRGKYRAKLGEEAEEEEERTDDELVQVPQAKGSPEALGPGTVAEFSSSLTQKERGKLLKQFSSGKVMCLICSDVVARGIDIPEVTAVVNYTAPAHLQTYIHRVGRTARAGKVGHTFTFVTRGDMDRFEKMLRESADCWERISKFPIPKEARSRKKAWWTPALEALQRCLDLESKGHLSPVKPLAMDNLLTSALPTAKPPKPRGVRAAPVELVEEKEVKEKRVKEKEEKSMLDFLKDGWGT